jgi:hypothetical protein
MTETKKGQLISFNRMLGLAMEAGVDQLRQAAKGRREGSVTGVYDQIAWMNADRRFIMGVGSGTSGPATTAVLLPSGISIELRLAQQSLTERVVSVIRR